MGRVDPRGTIVHNVFLMSRSGLDPALNVPAQRLEIRRPDDWHTHLRDGELLRLVIPYTARVFGRAVVMPNLVPPVTTREMARAYRERIQAALPADSRFAPLMTCYLTDDSDPDEIAKGYEEGTFFACKLYPAHATTNSQFGVSTLDRISGVLGRLEEIGMPLLIHGETADPEVDVFDRERVFVERTLRPLLERHQGLKAVLEHVTTEEALDFVLAQAGRLGATVTPHHLVINRTAIFAGGLQPDLYCLPVAKREHHRLTLRKAVTSGAPQFFLGTDSAPHTVASKHSGRAPAGIFNSATAIETYAQVFEEEGALDRLEAFSSLNGARFYGLEPNSDSIVLERRPRSVPAEIGTDPYAVRLFQGGQEPTWTVAD